DVPARSESDVALAVAEGQADAGLAIEEVARRHRLGFVPMLDERYDLALWRRDVFEPPIQRLLTFAGSAAFRERAAALGGYDVSGFGTIHRNGP
ncbi:MAG TPA: substrate-binding domain-containing protein, partial [Thalassobaculum sp.]